MTKITFSFGKNWQNFLRSLTEERIKIARSSITEFMKCDNFQDKTFVDIGCGSGLFSYAAFQLGAKQILSIDLDPFSIECCEFMRNKAGNPEHWQIRQGSILDKDFVQEAGQFDIVYSWGVLHHTGKMWVAIKNAAGMVGEGGQFYVALYRKTWSSGLWVWIKRFYNLSPLPFKRILEGLHIFAFIIACLVQFKNPFRYMKNYKAERGMSFYTDVVDWLGGYPYEFVTADEVEVFMKENFSDFTLSNTLDDEGIGNISFLFKRT